MASIDPKAIVLEDRWPGMGNAKQGYPGQGLGEKKWEAKDTSAVYQHGEKIIAYNDYSDNYKGWYTMIYLNFKEGATSAYDADSDLTNGTYMCAWYDQSDPQPFRVTNDVTESDMTETGRIAIAAADLSDGEWGWFWCGGVCPLADITKWDITGIVTDGLVANGHAIFPDDATGQGRIGCGDATSITDVTIGISQVPMPSGWAMDDDT